MSSLHHLSESSLHGVEHHEPDSELRDALQRVARDLEFKSQQHKRQEGPGLHSDGTSKDHADHDGDDIQVEDILSHVRHSRCYF